MMDRIYQKAQERPARMVFPEAEEEKILLAASKAAQAGYIIPVLVGKLASMTSECQRLGIDRDIFEFYDIEDEETVEKLASSYETYSYALFKGKSLRRRLSDPLYYAMVLTAIDKVDAVFAGLSHPTGEVILAGQSILCLQKNIETVSSCGILDIPGFEGAQGSLIAFGDAAVCQNPTSESLSDIAIATCDTVKSLLDWEPHCAFLSYSTQGSGTGELVDKVVKAVKIAQEKRPDLLIEGEFQLDTAMNPMVAKKKVLTDSNVAGQANVLIFPDLNAGNIGVKLLQQFAHADAYGPMITGMNKVISDCSRSAPVSELVGNIALTAVRAMY
ncbi:phosphate acyltransferase [Streptococcus moroccensis]|uniref:Phosphate acetyltransferase n=1 Tax=Streptococcus moroccensis TaxID=1451356 RepID=A0ABT9YSP2_9STRE|nr:phosphate acyltransferase [Streptococcus moroccensis]MDQ0222348.1 phosphate acetyltransferase [Streptococcus moroccensis]